MNRVILITGCAGFIGHMTAIKFLQKGHKVVGVDNINDYYSVRLKQWRLEQIRSIGGDNFEFIEGDLSKDILSSLDENIDFDAVIHLAAQAGVRFSLEKPERYIDSNVVAFDKLLTWMKFRDIDKLLYASSSSVYGKMAGMPLSETINCNQPESYYAATKIANEMMAHASWRSHSKTSLGMRFFTVYGPAGRPDMAPIIFSLKALNSEVIKLFNFGRQQRDFTYIDDIVESIYRLYGVYSKKVKSAELINIGCGSPVSLESFVDILKDCSGKDLLTELVPEQPGDVRSTYADTNKLERWIGFWKKTGFEKGLGLTYSWVKENRHLL